MNRFKRIDVLTIAFFCTMVAALFLAEPPFAWRSLQHFWNLGHVVLFFLFCRVAILFFPTVSRWPAYRRIILLLSLTFVLGSAIELYQLFVPGRDSSLVDIAADLAGACLYLGLLDDAKRRIRAMTLLAAALLSASSILPGLADLFDEITAIRQFPVLADFETPFESTRFIGPAKFSISDHVAFSGSRSLLLQFGTDKYSWINLKYFNGDWSAFKTFSCAVFNPGRQPIKFYLSIDDRLHERGAMKYSDRFNTTFILSPGWNRLRVPLAEVRNAPQGRKMDMRAISRVGLFVVQEPKPLTLYLDDLELEK